ncbi:gap junction delta-4 protein [Lissotriton helveticus]
MQHWNWLGFLVVTLNYNVTIVGKIWITSTIFLRMAVIVLAGYPLYQDEQEKFVCNTLQPGCSNACYDIFSPVSHFRFWLAQVLCLLLLHALFDVYVLSKAASQHMGSEISTTKRTPSPNPAFQMNSQIDSWKILDFSGAYLVHLLIRTITEAGFSTGQYYLFGLFVPKTFSCFEPPCTGSIECYISRPTEKSLMMIFMWAVSGSSLLLSIVDLIFVIHRRATGGTRSHRLLLMESDYPKDGRCSALLPQDAFPEPPDFEENHHLQPHHQGPGRKKTVDPACDYSPSFRSNEDEATSIDYGGIAKDTARSNMNSNSNKKAYSLQVSLTPPGSTRNALVKIDEPSVITNRQGRLGKEDESQDPVLKSKEKQDLGSQFHTSPLGDESLEEITSSVHSDFIKSTSIRSQKSEWV